MNKYALIFLCSLWAGISRGEPTVDEPAYYAEIGGGGNPDALWVAGGVEGYVADWLSLYAGAFAAGVEEVTDNGNDGFAGLTLGMRLCVPSRISPYVGGGVAIGWSRDDVLADNDGRDNDNDDVVDEPGEEEREYEIVNSVFPEAGIHIWLDKAQRLTFNYRYHFTSEGEDTDFWTANLGFMISY